jgi:putative redox protein
MAIASPKAGEVIVQGSARGFFQEIQLGGHRLVSDEPVEVGGTEQGPSPYDLLLAALGSCTSMTVGLYARRKGWPLEAVRVLLNHSKIHAQDCEDCETKVGMLDLIERNVELIGPLDGEQRSRLLEIANRCPVHRTLTSEIAIRTRLVENDRGR